MKRHEFSVPPMQSIWFGRQEKIFGSEEVLVDYIKKAIDFAAAIDCKNLVFGCPRNRDLPENADASVGVSFFKKIGDYAASKGTVLGMGVNPPIYNTNCINDTASAIALIKQVDSEGFKLKLDVGTMIHNQESVETLKDHVTLINHVHISEPGLKTIERWTLHLELKGLLLGEGYSGFVSTEMGKTEDLSDWKMQCCT